MKLIILLNQLMVCISLIAFDCSDIKNPYKALSLVESSQCQPVLVNITKTDKCYNELPVIFKEKNYFISPRNRI